jgi:hypothetical protein
MARRSGPKFDHALFNVVPYYERTDGSTVFVLAKDDKSYLQWLIEVGLQHCNDGRTERHAEHSRVDSVHEWRHHFKASLR